MNKNLVYGVVLVVGLLAAAAFNWLDAPRNDAARSADAPFDFYVLALSWSPAYCASERGQSSPMQCGRDADFGFITHGLWPQFEQGWPSFCQSPHGDRMPRQTADTLLDIMPDRGLIAHQWDKHGTCSGLSPADYAAITQRASRQISIPDIFQSDPPPRLDAREVEAAFMRANPNLRADGVAVSCPAGRFTEVRICLDTNLSPRACQQVDRNGCRQQNLSVTQR